MNGDGCFVALAVALLAVVIASTVGQHFGTVSIEKQLIERNHGLYCPSDGLFVFDRKYCAGDTK
jgi:hypothetical protein